MLSLSVTCIFPACPANCEVCREGSPLLSTTCSSCIEDFILNNSGGATACLSTNLDLIINYNKYNTVFSHCTGSVP